MKGKNMKMFFLVLSLHLVIPTYVFLLTACAYRAKTSIAVDYSTENK